MKEQHFIQQRQATWSCWERWLSAAAKKRRYTDANANANAEADRNAAATKPKADPPPETELPTFELVDIPAQFRQLSSDLALARQRNYSWQTQERLHQLMLGAHQFIYGARQQISNPITDFLRFGLPCAVRQQWRVVLLSAALFFVPLFGLVVIIQYYPSVAYLLQSPEALSNFEEMYHPGAKRLGMPRDAETDWMMLGYYLSHNIQIDFQCFAGGLFFGIGAIFYIFYNGLSIGAVAGHLTHVGYIETFWGFVAGHSAFELTGAVLSGAAGLKIGAALVFPGAYSRSTALRQAAITALPLIWGGALLTFMAAFIEAFWSPMTQIPPVVKYAVGLTLIVLTNSYFILVGRRAAQ